MDNSEIKYDRSQDRQGLFDEVFFKKLYSDNLWLMNQWIDEAENARVSLNSGGDLDKNPSALPAEIYLVAMIEYTAGHPIDAVYQRFEQAIEYSQLCLDINAKHPVDDPELLEEGWTMSVWGNGISLTENLPNAIGLCILFDRIDWLNIVRGCYLVADWDDPAFSALINMVIPTEFDPKQKFPKGGFNFRKPLLQAIMAESKEETLKHLNAYLAGWYEGNRKIGNNVDTHLDQDPEWGGYYGYWSFESAAVAYLKDIDDTELRQYLYYPKDMVDWAREQRRIKQSEEQDNRLPLLLPKGTTAPFAGKYGIDNFIGHEIMVEQGERLPAGRVSAQYDENGEPLHREDTVWRLLQREDGGNVRFEEEELRSLQKQ